MNRVVFFFIIVLVFFLSSCREEVDLGGYTIAPQLVVDGRITNELQRHRIRLSLSGDYREGEAYKPVSGALVSITDGSETFFLEEGAPGQYETDSLAGIPGREYRLAIEWEGALFEAFDTMGLVPPPFIPVEFVTDGSFRTMEYRRHQFGFPEANGWELVVGPSDSLRPVNVDVLGQQIGVEVDTTGTYAFYFFTHPNIEVNGLMNFEEAHFYGFHSGRAITQKRFSLSPPYYQYLRALFSETEWRGTLFDSTPGAVRGNVSNGGLGFFSAQAVRVVEFEI